MSSSLDAIRRVVEAFERSDWSEIDVRSGDVRVHLVDRRASDRGSHVRRPPPRPSTRRRRRPTVPATIAAAADARPAVDGIGDRAADRRARRRVAVAGHLLALARAGCTAVRRRRRQRRRVGTVCIVEVMKLMTHVKAGVSGEVVAVYVENGVAVQKGEPLFAIAPSGSST